MTPGKSEADKLDDPSIQNADEVAKAFGADIENGLTKAEAARRLLADGPNELRSTPRHPAWRRFLLHFHDPLIYLLLAAIVIALVAWITEGMGGWPVDAIVITTVVLFNGVLGFMQEARAQNAVAALARMTAVTSAVMRNGQVLRVPSAELRGTHDLNTARTAGFTVLVLAHLINAFSARSASTSAFAHLFTNPWLWGALGLSLLLQVAVAHLDFLNLAFGTVPLTLEQWVLCVAMASTVLWVSELRKLARRAFNR